MFETTEYFEEVSDWWGDSSLDVDWGGSWNLIFSGSLGLTSTVLCQTKLNDLW
jgi:hypothetical protein